VDIVRRACAPWLARVLVVSEPIKHPRNVHDYTLIDLGRKTLVFCGHFVWAR